MRRKIIGSLVLLFAIFSVGATVASYYVAVGTTQMRRLVDLHEVEELRRDLVINVQTVQADLYKRGTVLASELDAIVKNVDGLDAAAGECASCHHPPDLAQDLEELEELIEDYKAVLSYYITASANMDRITEIKLEAAGIGNQILGRTEEMSATASRSLDEITEHATSKVEDVRIILLVTLLATTCLGIGVAWYLLRSVTKPIGRLVGATRILASGGLGHRIEERDETEFGELARHFNAMSSALERSYAGLRSGNEDLRREIRERKQAEQEREELQNELLQARKMEALGTLSAGIAHEFGNVLQIIEGCAGRLSSRGGKGSLGGREVEIINDAVERGAELSRGLLTFGRKAVGEARPIDLNDTVRRVKTILERTLPETIEIEVSLVEESLPVAADAAQIEQALLNLALNARDAMPEGGLLHLETSRGDEDGHASGTTSADGAGEWMVLRVSDNGHGIDHETLQHIFDPFFTTKDIGVGAGIGLATVYGIVTGFGGRITCQSDVGSGSVFEVRLPGLPGTSIDRETEGRPKEKVSRGTETILWVDDEITMLEVMSERLEEHGYRVHNADSGERAVELYEEHRGEIDLVVLDLGMPGMGGRACLDKLLEIDPEVKVIVVTGYGDRGHEAELMEAGASGFLAKPARGSDILNKIESVLRG
jgi:C4-dicarboxylate-specific signal transduction histidine kinase/CheY-like chemotaxis protein